MGVTRTLEWLHTKEDYWNEHWFSPITSLCIKCLPLKIIYVVSVLFCYAFMHVCLLMPCGHLVGKGWPLGSRLWCLLWRCHFSIGILGQVWCLIVFIPDLYPLSYFLKEKNLLWKRANSFFKKACYLSAPNVSGLLSTDGKYRRHLKVMNLSNDRPFSSPSLLAEMEMSWVGHLNVVIPLDTYIQVVFTEMAISCYTT